MYGKDSPYARWIVNGFRPYSTEYMLGQVNNPERSLYVAINNGSVIGTIILQLVAVPRHTVFHKFCVSPEYKGKGLGARLIAFVEKKAAAQGISRMRIEVFSPAFRLFNYYIEHGYTRVISTKALEEDQHIKFTCKMADYGFVTIEKRL